MIFSEMFNNPLAFLAVNGATMIVYCLCMFSLSYTKNGCVFCLAGLLNAFQFVWLVLMCVYFFSITAIVVVYKVGTKLPNRAS